MKFLIILLVLCSACNKQPQCPPYTGPTLDGHWETIQPKTPAWQYDFAYGRVRKYVMLGSTEIVSFDLEYSVRNDTLEITSEPSGANTIYRYKFVLDSLIEMQDISPGVSLAPLSLIIKT